MAINIRTFKVPKQKCMKHLLQVISNDRDLQTQFVTEDTIILSKMTGDPSETVMVKVGLAFETINSQETRVLYQPETRSAMLLLVIGIITWSLFFAFIFIGFGSPFYLFSLGIFTISELSFMYNNMLIYLFVSVILAFSLGISPLIQYFR
ncbi:MAG: hypothetical protein ACXQS8_09195, partial [Candidatus Helarchaeales archaeon]